MTHWTPTFSCTLNRVKLFNGASGGNRRFMSLKRRLTAFRSCFMLQICPTAMSTRRWLGMRSSESEFQGHEISHRQRSEATRFSCLRCRSCHNISMNRLPPSHNKMLIPLTIAIRDPTRTRLSLRMWSKGQCTRATYRRLVSCLAFLLRQQATENCGLLLFG
jgi:hypothetical protein